MPEANCGFKGTEHRVLDHGYIRLVDYMGSDLSVIRAARVSYAAAWRAGDDEDKDRKLLRRLWTGGVDKPALPAPAHSTPFEAVTFTFEVKLPIFVARQWHRHRTQSYNELSLRYKETPAEEFYAPTPGVIGSQSKDNKQGRSVALSKEEVLRRETELDEYRRICEGGFQAYKALLELGWPRELARCVLPVATYTHMFTTGNLRNFLAFLTLRADSHAQYEIQVYAHGMASLMELVVPEVMSLWFEATTMTRGDR